MRAAILAARVVVIGVVIGSAAFLVRSFLRARERDAWAERAAAASAWKHAGGPLDAGAMLRFENVRERLFPVLVPRGFAPGQKLVTLPFAGDVLEAFLFDGERHQHYVDEPTFERWGVERSTLHAAAIAALSSRVQSEVFSAQRPADTAAAGLFIAVDASDGYAAARLLLPAVRERLGKELGYPFFVGVPNRDFLVAWSSDYAFADQFANKVREDFSRRSYPVSPEVFRVEASGVSARAR